MVLKNFIKRILRTSGYQVVPLPPDQVTSIDIDANELSEIDRILKTFSKESDNPDLNDYKSLKSYLSNERIQIFHELVHHCERESVSFENVSIADVGSGMGYLFRKIAQVANPKQMTGYDTFSSIFPLAKAVCPTALYQSDSLYDIKDQHDIVFCMEVLEHMVDPQAALDKLLQITAPGGVLILSVPNGRYDFQEAGAIREDQHSYWGHIHFWSPESWDLFLNSKHQAYTSIKTGLLSRKHIYAIIHV